ncbi:hypothetical protein BASA81_013820 [Batrachochytrium salamandrivorans]|nr:hypothetical protein BASA81_013820 [Batrachochytrium salamandrivorans]
MQDEEIDVVAAVYGEEAVAVASKSGLRQLTVRVDGLCFHCELPKDYPDVSPPKVLNGGFAHSELSEVFVPGEPVLLAWIELVRDMRRQAVVSPPSPSPPSPAPLPPPPPPRQVANIVSSQILIINKSKFQAHAAVCRSASACLEMIQYVQYVHQKATHNMWAYRCGEEEDYNDDGEDQAGKRLSLVIHSMQAHNVAVVVTRYYGGIQLGPARFKYIMQTCREALEQL